jgi:hypothetical protein
MTKYLWLLAAILIFCGGINLMVLIMVDALSYPGMLHLNLFMVDVLATAGGTAYCILRGINQL